MISNSLSLPIDSVVSVYVRFSHALKGSLSPYAMKTVPFRFLMSLDQTRIIWTAACSLVSQQSVPIVFIIPDLEHLTLMQR